MRSKRFSIIRNKGNLLPSLPPLLPPPLPRVMIQYQVMLINPSSDAREAIRPSCKLHEADMFSCGVPGSLSGVLSMDEMTDSLLYPSFSCLRTP